MIKPRSSHHPTNQRVRRAKRLWHYGFRLLCVVGVWSWSALAQAEEWSVQGSKRRQTVIRQRFQQIVERKPTRGFAFKRLVQVTRKTIGLDRLIQYYRRRVKRYPRRANYRLLLGHLFHATRQREAALQQYLAVLKQETQHFQAYLYAAEIQQQLQRFDRAYKLYQRASPLAKTTRQRRLCLQALGTLALQRKQPKQALVFWRRYLALSPSNLRARENIARAMTRHRLYGEALKQWQVILQKTVGSAKRARVLRQIGLLYEQSGPWSRAVGAYRKAMRYTRAGHWLRRELNERILQLHREHGKLATLASFLERRKRKSKAEFSMLARMWDELGQHDKAMLAYRQALKRNRRDVKLRLKYITLLEIMSRPKLAFAQYKTLIRQEPREPRYRLSFAEMLSRQGRPKEALNEMQRIAKTFSGNVEVLGRLAHLYQRRRMNKEAIQLYKRLIRLAPRDPSYRRVLGSFYLKQGKPKQADRTWRSILRSGLPRARALLLLSQIYRDNHQLRKARVVARQAWHLKPKNPSYLQHLADIYQRLLDEEQRLPNAWLREAIKVWRTIYNKAKRRTQRKAALQQLFSLYEAQGTLYQKPRLYQDRLTQNPKDIRALRYLGEYALWRAKNQNGRAMYGQARAYFTRILKAQPQDLDALLTLESLAVRQQNWQLARLYLRRLAQFHKVGRRLYYRRLSRYNIKLRDYKGAILYGRKAIALSPDDPSTHADLARLYRKARRYREATAAYREALRLRPRSDDYLQSLAKLLYLQGKVEEATVLYRQLLRNTNDSQTIYEVALRLMALYLPRRQGDRLERDLQSLADARPRELSYFKALAELYRRQGKMKLYHIAYLKAAATVDQKSQVYKRLAQVAKEQGDLRKATIYYRKMLEETPNPTPRSQLQLAKLYLQLNQRPQAEKILFSLLNENPDALRVLRDIATLLDRYDLRRGAIQACEQFLELEPNSQSMRLRLAKLYQRQGQFEAAIGTLAPVIWGDINKPLRKASKRPKKSKRNKKRKYPFYLYRKQRRRRVMYQRQRYQVLSTLIELYHKSHRMTEWDRRILLGIQNPQTPNRDRLLVSLTRYYYKRRWFGRLERLLKQALFAEPNQVFWLSRLATLYQRQKRHRKAFRLYSSLITLDPGQRNKYRFQQLSLALAMKDRRRAKYLLDVYTSNNFNQRDLQRVLRLLNRSKQYSMMSHALRHYMRYSSRDDYAVYLKELATGYIQSGQLRKARRLLWSDWFTPRHLQSFGSNFQITLQRRWRQLSLLWPLLNEAQRRELRTHTQNRLKMALLGNKTHRLQQALLDVYTLRRMEQGPLAAQRYLPSLWAVIDRDTRFQHQTLRKLFQQGHYKTALVLIKQSMRQRSKDTQRLAYLRRLLTLLPRSGQSPPRFFSRYIEGQLLAQRQRLKQRVWLHLALTLSQQYLLWGDARRAIWWLERCRWTGHKKLRHNRDLLLYLARAYKRKGSERLARRNYRRVLRQVWKSFDRDPDRMLLFLIAQQALKQGARFHQRFYMKLYFYQMRNFRRNIKNPLDRAKLQMRALLQLYQEAGQLPQLQQKLYQRYHRQQNPKSRRLAFYHRLLGFQYLWKQKRNPSTYKQWSMLLRRSLGDITNKENRLFYMMLAQLEAEAGQLNKAIALYRKLRLHSAQKQKQKILSRLATLYGQAGREFDQHRMHLALSSRFRDAKADRWLANYYLERQQVTEAVRYYRKYQQRRSSNYSSYYMRRFRHRYELRRSLAMAEFLLPSGSQTQLLSYIQRSISNLRQMAHETTSRNNSLYHYFAQRIVNLLLHIGKLRDTATQWQQKQKRRSDDIHRLRLLKLAYKTLEEPTRQQNATVQLLRLEPNNDKLLQEVVKFYVRRQRGKRAIALLQELYKKRETKPNSYYTWMGRLSHEQQAHKRAKQFWRKQAQHCAKRSEDSERFSCAFALGDVLVQHGQIKTALSTYLQALQRVNTPQIWRIRRAAQHLLRKSATTQAIKLLRQAIGRKLPPRLSLHTLGLLESLVEAYDKAKQPKKKAALLKALTHKRYYTPYAEHMASSLLESANYYLDAERLYWKTYHHAGVTSQRRTAYQQLCAYWQRRGLPELCDLHALKAVLSKPRLHFKQTQKLQRAGFLRLAMLEARRLWLAYPNNALYHKALVTLTQGMGRREEAEHLMAHAQSRGRNAVTPVEGGPQSLRYSALQQDRPSWAPQHIPGWCRRWSLNKGKLNFSRCQKRSLRCTRRLTRIGKLIVTNDCMGHIAALDASTGHARWFATMPSPRLLHWPSRNTTGTKRTSVTSRNVYRVHTLREHRGRLVVAINESWQEHSQSWLSGFHVRAHLLLFEPTTGKRLSWHRFSNDFFGRSLHVQGRLASFYGRRFRVVDIKTGKTLWSRGQGGHYEAWLYSARHTIPHVHHGDMLVVPGRDKVLRAYDSHGKLRWRRRFSDEFEGLLHAKGSLFVTTASRQLHALHLQNGRSQWTRQLEGSAQSREREYRTNYASFYRQRTSPMIVGQRLLISNNNGSLLALDTRTGKTQWRRDLGDHSIYPPTPDPQQNALVTLGNHGLLVQTDLAQGKAQWLRRFPTQYPPTNHRHHYHLTHPRPLVGTRRVWLGIYDSFQHFKIVSLWRNPSAPQRYTARLQRFLQNMRRQRQHKEAARLLAQATPPNDSLFRAQYLRLAGSQGLDYAQRLFWAYAYLSTGRQFNKDLGLLKGSARSLPTHRFDYTPPLPRPKPYYHVMQLILLSSHKTLAGQRRLVRHWYQLLLGSQMSRLKKLDTPLARRFAASLLRHPKQDIRTIAALSLVQWRDHRGQAPLRRLLQTPTTKLDYYSKKLLPLVTRQLFAWRSNLTWKGSYPAIYAKQLQPLLRHRQRDVRLRAATALASFILKDPRLQKLDTARLRQQLLQAGQMPQLQIAITAASALGSLGDRRGVERLRQLMHRTRGYYRTQIAERLLQNFHDDAGRTVLRNNPQQQQQNLQLPSFRLLHAERLMNLQRHREALLHYQAVVNVSAAKKSPQHHAQALYGVARCHYATKHYRNARRYLQQALRIDPMMTMAQEYLGRIAYHEKRFTTARKLLSQAYQHAPTESHERVYYLALALYNEDRPAKVAGLLKGHEQRVGPWHHKHYYHAKIALHAPRPALRSALRHIKRGLQRWPHTPRYLVLQARILRRLKQHQKARSILQDAIKQSATDAPSRRRYQRLYLTWFGRNTRKKRR